MLNYKRLAPRNADPKIYTHNNEKITHQEADMINNGTFIEGETSVSGEYITAQEVVLKLAAQHKHVNYMIGGDELNELVCYYTWSSDTISPTGVYIPDLNMTVEDRRLLAYEITPENADVTSAVFSIVSGSDIAHIDGSYVVADHLGTATYKVVVNGSIEDTATITVSNKPEEFPDDAQHRWIRVQPESSLIPIDGGTIHVTGSYGLTGSYGTEKKVGDITDTIVIESNSSLDPKSGSKTYHYNNNLFDTPTAEITWTQPGRSEEFPDDEEHRWIEVSPTQFTFPADGGSVDITGSYGLTGTFGTRKKVGDITDTITVDANPSTSSRSGSKTYYYNNDSSQTPTSEVTWTQDGREEVFTYKYFIKVGYKLDTLLKDRILLVWQNDQYSLSSKKTFYIKSFKCKINEHGETVATELTGYSIRHSSSGSDNFSISNHNIATGLGLVDCFPIEENTSYQSQKSIGFLVYNEEDGTVFCYINLIQEKKGILIVSGDAVMFTYNWDNGTDLDLATFVNLNLPASNDHNYAGYFGRIISEYWKILYFAGDNTGTGNEYAFIDFKEISKYLNEHMDDLSSIDGKTILQSLTDDNGSIKILCDLYTNWYRTKLQENITLSYSVYNKDSEDASVTTQDKQFVLNGYTKIKDSSDLALCYASGTQNVSNNVNVKDGYTLSAKFIYYLDSGVFAFETNKDDVGKWHKGTNFSAVSSNASYSNAQFTKDDNNIDFSISIDSVNEPDYFDKNNKVIFYVRIYQKGTSNYSSIGKYETTINLLPYRLESSIPLSKVIKDMNFGENNTVEIYPRVSFESNIINYSEEKYLNINDIALIQNVLTLLKLNT